MRQRSFCTVLTCLQLVFLFGITSGKAALRATENVEFSRRDLLSVNEAGKADAECAGCGYTPDAPAPGGDVPRCGDVLCLVQGLLDKKSLIYVERDIDISGSGPLPDVTSEVTIMGTCIDGAPCKIDGKGGSQIFVVGLNGYLTLKDLEITGASCVRGSAVTVSGSGSNDSDKGGKFVALNVKFTRNLASEIGGALNVESGGIAYLEDCIFRANKAVRGGAVFVGSSKDFPANGQNSSDSDPITCALNSCTTFVNTEFTENTADFGGAVYVDDAAGDCKDNGGAKVDCTTCAFNHNRARKEGGAVFVNYQSAGAIAYLRKTRFRKNTAKLYGGDVATQEGQYGTRGAQLYAYQVAFSGSTAEKGSSVAVKPFSFSTFARCDFSPGSSLQCEGSCDTFCPSATPLTNASAYGPNGESCPVPPVPLCSWIPAECQGSRSSEPPPSSPPSPPPSPPSSNTPPSSTSPPPPSSQSPPPAASSPPPPPSSPPPALRSRHPPLLAAPPSQPPVSAPPSQQAPAPETSPPSQQAPESSPPSQQAPESSPPSQSAGSKPPAASHSASGGKHRHHNGSITGDPHFVGKHGERFDFHGKGGRDYCIVSDKDLHVNMHVFKGLHRRTTFISKIGLLYKSDRVLVDAQANKLAADFDDQWKILVNNAELPKEQTIKTYSGLEITHLPRAVQIRMQDELDVNVTVMPTGYGRFGSGANYLDFQINKLKVSSNVHGVLGQTYQESMETYKKIEEARAKRLKRSRAASIFMDGSENDYLSSSITAPDCKYSAYIDQSQISKRVQRMVLEGAQALLGMNKRDQVVVRQCTGFGHSLCPLALED